MHKFFNMLRALILYWKFKPSVVDEWKEEDQEVLRNFLYTKTGQKLQDIVRQSSIAHAENATSKVVQLRHACGFALGFRACFATILTLTAILTPRDEENENVKTGDRGFEL